MPSYAPTSPVTPSWGGGGRSWLEVQGRKKGPSGCDRGSGFQGLSWYKPVFVTDFSFKTSCESDPRTQVGIPGCVAPFFPWIRSCPSRGVQLRFHGRAAGGGCKAAITRTNVGRLSLWFSHVLFQTTKWTSERNTMAKRSSVILLAISIPSGQRKLGHYQVNQLVPEISFNFNCLDNF